VSIILVSAVDASVLASVESMAGAYGVALLGVLQKPLTPASLQALIGRRAAAAAAAPGTRGAAPAFSAAEIARGISDDEFEPWFQPKVELETRRVQGLEALARWRHPAAGVVAPGAFIDVMEEQGLIDDLTWRMLHKSAAACREWRQAGLDLRVSVNLSVKSLADVTLADRVGAIVQQEGLEPRHMVLEVTESAAVAANAGQVLENLSRLRLKGFGLSIDDYGTGYSSMQQLGRIAFTELKIDQCFLQQAATSQASRIILHSSLEMARKLGLAAVAEGVETQQQWDLLRELDCELAQGYFIARPMEAAAVPGWIAQWQERA
jgi:EAL domain-containing protein (putative c-di-GMP-specific phosphodiesterase class I)